jgi:hypothetical protein
MSIAKTTLLLGFISLGFILVVKGSLKLYKKNSAPTTNSTTHLKPSPASITKTLKLRAQVLKEYTKKNGFDTTTCFMINMGIASGKKRFFVYNLQKDAIEESGLVAHGSGSNTKSGELKFNNTIGGLATSLGKYKIGNSYYGAFGLAYKLYGLDASNNKAIERFVVLHSHDCVPSEEVDPFPICVSWGCPTVAPSFLKILQQKIAAAKQPILLDIQYTK